jgi:hypothetical protein
MAAAPAAAVESKRRRVIRWPAGGWGKLLSCVCVNLRLRTKSPTLIIRKNPFAMPTVCAFSPPSWLGSRTLEQSAGEGNGSRIKSGANRYNGHIKR